MSSDEVTVVLGELDAAFDKLAAVDVDTLTHPELLAVLDHLETHRRCQPAVEHRLISRLAAEADTPALGGAGFLRHMVSFEYGLAKVASSDLRPADVPAFMCSCA